MQVEYSIIRKDKTHIMNVCNWFESEAKANNHNVQEYTVVEHLYMHTQVCCVPFQAVKFLCSLVMFLDPYI